MKNIILIKQHPCIQLGHLYEHLFMRQVNRLFYNHGVFKHLDYSAHGKTFNQGGIISIEIELYTDLAFKFEEKIYNLSIDFGDNNRNISTEVARIIAEEHHKLYIQDSSKIIEALTLLDQSPWRHIDEINQLNTQNTRKQSNPLYLVDELSAKPHSLSATLSLNDSFAHKNPSLAPLFSVISRIILLSIGDAYSSHFGFYSSHLTGKIKPLTATHTLTVAPLSAKLVTIDQLILLSNEVTNYVLSSATIGRLVETLQLTDYRKEVLLAQNFETILEETGVLTGSAGWRTIATRSNIEQVIAHTTLSLSFKHQKASLTLT